MAMLKINRDRILLQIWRTAIVNLGVSKEVVVHQVGRGKFNRLFLSSNTLFALVRAQITNIYDTRVNECIKITLN